MAALVGAVDDHWVAREIESRLGAQACAVSGSSDSASWATPTALWADDAYKKRWYTHAADYWQDAARAPPTVDGVLGGFAALDAPDVLASRSFLDGLAALRPLWDGAGVALDVAAGIGRVTKHLLLPRGFRRVDVLEQAASLVGAAPDFIAEASMVAAVAVGGEEAVSKCRFICAAMQTWAPKARGYDLVWFQWCVGHFTDGDFVRALHRYRAALAPHGVLCIKDNVFGNDTEDAFFVDDDDRSLCRSRLYYLAIFEIAGAVVVSEKRQRVYDADEPRADGDADCFPDNIFPVITWALVWAEDQPANAN
ncbi:AdoMet dependent proline di-methyltransferase-domain-containing protein [Pelagophyceae sp. CCMP2097]|nr:AdoMet dependent proline di-methyltransferase-domain-containing protein [Pelagophyceae sp. CCMP2097]|mmetsp:Transcript_4170/g.14627  ORF Transcript_4170/g.14627 Transcript_4170/m.14627 type:complete len:309 (+) Transcript_4170:30-956(+)